jgi:hypothetical protein
MVNHGGNQIGTKQSSGKVLQVVGSSVFGRDPDDNEYDDQMFKLTLVDGQEYHTILNPASNKVLDVEMQSERVILSQNPNSHTPEWELLAVESVESRCDVLEGFLG